MRNVFLEVLSRVEYSLSDKDGSIRCIFIEMHHWELELEETGKVRCGLQKMSVIYLRENHGG